MNDTGCHLRTPTARKSSTLQNTMLSVLKIAAHNLVYEILIEHACAHQECAFNMTVMCFIRLKCSPQLRHHHPAGLQKQVTMEVLVSDLGGHLTS